MRLGQSPQLTDPADLRFRLATIKTGCWLTFATGWSFLIILLVVTLGLLDRRVPSPLLLPLYMPLIFAGMSYPIRTAIVIASLTLVGYVLVAIVDDFKLVNDRDGHAAGDALLVLVVERITTALRPGDAIGRLGGDEFAVALPGTGDSDAGLVIARLSGALPDHVGASFGHSCFPGHGISPDELLRHVDEGLYAAKRARPGHHAAAVDLSWATALADAVDRRMGAGPGHSVSVAGYAARVAAELGWDDEEIGQRPALT